MHQEAFDALHRHIKANDKQTVLHLYNGIRCSNVKEDVCNSTVSMDLKVTLGERYQDANPRATCVLIPLHHFQNKIKIVIMDMKMVAAWG